MFMPRHYQIIIDSECRKENVLNIIKKQCLVNDKNDLLKYIGGCTYVAVCKGYL